MTPKKLLSAQTRITPNGDIPSTPADRVTRMSNEEDQIANTQMFRAFVANGEPEGPSAARRAVVIGVIALAIVAAIAAVILIQS